MVQYLHSQHWAQLRSNRALLAKTYRGLFRPREIDNQESEKQAAPNDHIRLLLLLQSKEYSSRKFPKNHQNHLHLA